MKTKPCKCCEDGQSGHKGKATGFGYNRLDGEVREWAAKNRFAKSEYCVPVKNGKRFGGPDWIKNRCGDGRMGFSTRRKNQDEARMERGLGGQLKKRRNSLVNKRSARATKNNQPRRVDGSIWGLVSTTAILRAQRDPIKVALQRKLYKKLKRAQNRNNKARRGRKR